MPAKDRQDPSDKMTHPAPSWIVSHELDHNSPVSTVLC